MTAAELFWNSEDIDDTKVRAWQESAAPRSEPPDVCLPNERSLSPPKSGRSYPKAQQTSGCLPPRVKMIPRRRRRRHRRPRPHHSLPDKTPPPATREKGRTEGRARSSANVRRDNLLLPLLPAVETPDVPSQPRRQVVADQGDAQALPLRFRVDGRLELAVQVVDVGQLLRAEQSTGVVTPKAATAGRRRRRSARSPPWRLGR